MREIREPTVFIVRHGKTEFNLPGDESRLKGLKYDLPLTDKGHEEAESAAKHLAQFPIASLKSSLMLRAKQTARPIAKATGTEEAGESALDPWDVGYLSGQKRQDAKRRIEYYLQNDFKTVPGGERYRDWYERYADFLASELKKAGADPNKARILVTHSCNAMATKSAIRGTEPEFYGEHSEAPGGIIRLSKQGGQWRMNVEDQDG